MQGAVEGESQDSAFLRQALLGARIRAATLCPSPQIQPLSTTAIPVVIVVPPQSASYHPAVSTSSQPLPPLMPLLRTAHPLRVRWYRQLLFELVEPVLLSAEEYKASKPYTPLHLLSISGC
jgi:hypothetical protein